MAILSSLRLGDGPAHAVLLHGFLGSGRNLRGLAQRWLALAPSRSLWLFDLTGHGASPPLSPDADLDSMARDVDETATAAGLASGINVVGHSLGGRVALAWLRQAPSRFEALTLLDIAPGPIPLERSSSRRVLDVLLRAPAEAPDRRTLRQALVDGGLAPGVADWVVMNVVCEPGAPCRWRIDRTALDALHDHANTPDLWSIVASADVGVRAIRGGRSGYVTEADVARFQSLGCDVTTLPNAGHDVHIDAVDDVARLLAS